ncbi:sulfite exporter TauE/SafE family protein [Microlunatus soli]|uniref:Probable membrane transporter protein n=1 Tax=Microlunatus soli TaxID=630515 RepID=A0A1H1MHC5_9ACTN|nr:sulfite exporter TauE/SafE family protein [Microlunatus soli]SDR86012.1 hypothetical protein SAMN04489812_0132 [Microlunatus soli]
MTALDAGALLAAAAVAGALGGALGMAGGVFIVPLLTTVAHLPWPSAVAISLVAVVASSCAATPAFLTAGLPNLRLAVLLEVPTVGGAIAGVLLADRLPTRLLYGVFALVLLVSAVQLARGRRTAPVTAPDTKPNGWRLDGSVRDGDVSLPYRVSRVPVGLGAMFGAGLLSSMLGIGSGVLKIPAMDGALRLPIKVSSATASLMIGVTAAGTAAAAVLQDGVDLSYAVPVVLGSVLGSTIGARVLVRIPNGPLRVLFFLVLLGLAVPMIMNAVGAR